MRKLLPLHRVAEELGYHSEGDLATILRHVVGLPYETRKGVICADPDELADALAERGILVPAEFQDASSGDGEDADEEVEDAAPRRRR